MNDRERLEEFLELVEDLIECNLKVPIIVEGKKDRRALKILGFKGDIYSLNHGIPLFRFCEEYAERHKKAIILTDWDHKGGRIARTLREGLAANGVKFDVDSRAKLVRLCKKDIKDVEGLPKFLELLKKRIEEGIRKRLSLARRNN